MKLRILFLSAFLCLCASAVTAQKTWEKPYQKWNQDDVSKVLTKSPWIKTYQSTDTAVSTNKSTMSDEIESLRKQSAPPNSSQETQAIGSSNTGPPVVTVRLHSARPVRQALVRLQEIAAGYDKMDEKKRAEFDASMKAVLECPLCQRFYILTMGRSLSALNQGVEDGLFQSMNLEQLKGNIWLVNDKGEKLELAQFIPPKSGKDLAVFFFPRTAGFLTPQDGSFRIVFNNEFFTATNPYAKFLPRDFEFKVSNLLIDNKLEF